MADNPPDTSVGARSCLPPPQQTPADVSAAALAGQLQDMLSGERVRTDSAGGVQRTVTQQQGSPVTVHTAALSFAIPFGG
jgi:hypothetical protein